MAEEKRRRWARSRRRRPSFAARWWGGLLQESEAANPEEQAAARSRPREATLLHRETTVQLITGDGGSTARGAAVAHGQRRRHDS